MGHRTPHVNILPRRAEDLRFLLQTVRQYGCAPPGLKCNRNYYLFPASY